MTDLIQASPVGRNLADVKSRMEAAAHAAARSPNAVTLVAVSKTHPASAIQQALEAGQRVFGENRVQEAERMFGPLKV